MTFYLAQVNIGRMLAPIDSPTMAGFVAGLDPINALAEGSPGFIWRLKTDEGNATSLRPYEDEFMIINMSVWTDIEALFQFTYYGNHIDYMRQRSSWFERMKVYVTLWYVPHTDMPTPADAQARLAHLETHGPTPYAFTFKQRFSVADLG